ncbi:MAG: glutamate-cysteine ligase family protein [Candidatus Helarchaeota archaeon]
MDIFKKKPLGKCPRCGNITSARWIKLGKEIQCENCGLKLLVISKRKQKLETKKKNLGIVDTLEEAYGISMGIEIETYTIRIAGSEYSIGYDDVVYPKEQVFEDGEIFTQDLTIGSEFNSPVFYKLHNAFFRLKASLRKYNIFQDKSNSEDGIEKRICFMGTWLDAPAATHFHVGYGSDGIEKDDAEYLAQHIHSHLSFIIALSANSPVINHEITSIASNRLKRFPYCNPINIKDFFKAYEKISDYHFTEMNYNTFPGSGEESKPPTLEIRVADSNIPEYCIACLAVIQAIVLKAIRSKKGKKIKPINICDYDKYLEARINAINDGSNAKISWNNKFITVSKYIDKFFYFYKKEIEEIEIPPKILDIFKYLKNGVNMADIIRESCTKKNKRFSNKWENEFCKQYVLALEQNLEGNDLENFAGYLGIKLPKIDKTILGETSFYSP